MRLQSVQSLLPFQPKFLLSDEPSIPKLLQLFQSTLRLAGRIPWGRSCRAWLRIDKASGTGRRFPDRAACRRSVAVVVAGFAIVVAALRVEAAAVADRLSRHSHDRGSTCGENPRDHGTRVVAEFTAYP